MKKMHIILIFLLFIGGCYLVYGNIDKKQVNTFKEQKQEELRGVFISYIDYKPYFKEKTKEEITLAIDKMINNVKSSDFNTIILQVRPFSDAIYNSNLFKPSLTVVNNEEEKLNLDILEYFIDKSHTNNIKVYAWVNPYRVRTTNNTSDISKQSKIYEWINTNNLYVGDDGVYLNPASLEVLDYILKGIEEIVKNYDVDAVVYDDYFYPNKKIDIENYNEYKGSGGNKTIEEYRIDNINNLIRKTYSTIKNTKENVLFGISPSGNIENNLNNEYLDIENILKEGIIDFVMPQLYYGFFNQNKPFQETITNWDKLIPKNIKMYPALALYKAGKEDKYAGDSGLNEWMENKDIIKKQIIISRAKENYGGFSIFRYSNLFNNEEEAMKEEINNIKQLLKS